MPTNEQRQMNIAYDEKYDIRLAAREDIPAIMRFLDENWRKGHIMARNRALFEYEYVHGDDVDMILAVEKSRKTIEGLFGFLRCTEKKTGDLWGSMWKVREAPDQMKLLGVELAKRIHDLTGCRSHIGSGANPETTVPLRKIFFRDKTATMKQYYRLNPEKTEFKIAKITDGSIPPKPENAPDYTLRELETFEDFTKAFDITKTKAIPQKDNWYIRHRFYEHPVYDYTLWGVQDEAQKTQAVLITREVSAEGAKALRIVDFLGDHRALEGLYDAVGKLLLETGCEYIDFVEFGVDDELLRKAGFTNRAETGNVIPHYFEPFLRENKDIWVHYKEYGTTFFKADGDQDRPNR